MQTVSCLIFCLFYFFVSGSIDLTMAQNSTSVQRINLTAQSQPLGDVLAAITHDTGYQFNLKREWQDYPVSGNLRDMPLEQGLKRLLKGLNHTIIWESEKTITIKVIGKVDPRRPVPVTPISLSSLTRPAKTEPITDSNTTSEDEAESVEGSFETTETDSTITEEEMLRDDGDQSEGSEDSNSEPEEQAQSTTDTPQE